MEEDQQFCLRWNNHQSTLIAVFDTLLEHGTLVDCTLAAEGKFLNAHKVVLSACSPYFEALLSQNYDKQPIFILKDVKFQELKAMMDYMYRGEVNISQDQLGALLKAAESLQIKGLSDNKPKETERKPAPPPPVSKSPPPTASLPRVQGLTIEQRRANRSLEDREGSQSPGPRKRKRMRRRSTEDLDNHDASNSSESYNSNPPMPNIPIALPPPPSSKLLTDVPEPIEPKTEILKLKEPEIVQVPIIKEKLETHTELMLEPKAEYIEEMNEDSIEDLTLDDDDGSNFDMSNDGAGPSHGNMDGSGQGFAGWHIGNQNQDEVFLAAQEAVGAHRDNQDDVYYASSLEEYSKLRAVNYGVRYGCAICNKTYCQKKTLGRHLRLDCGKSPSFLCQFCPRKFKHGYMLLKHMRHSHNISIDNLRRKCEPPIKSDLSTSIHEILNNGIVLPK